VPISDISVRMGVKKPTKVTPVHSAKLTQSTCLKLLRASLFTFQGERSSFMRALRSPSAHFSIQRKVSVQTVCGQA
jgi:hypothetical protein